MHGTLEQADANPHQGPHRVAAAHSFGPGLRVVVPCA